MSSDKEGLLPPWVKYPGYSPGDPFWRQSGEYYLAYLWTPFWDSLSSKEKEQCLQKWPKPRSWVIHEELMKELDDNGIL